MRCLAEAGAGHTTGSTMRIIHPIIAFYFSGIGAEELIL